jgi:hypothetical protein
MIGKYEKPLPEANRFVKQNAFPVFDETLMLFRVMQLLSMRETDLNMRKLT